METVHKIDEKGRKKGCPLGKNCDNCNFYRPTYRNTQGEPVQEYDCQANNLVMFIGELNERLLGIQRAMESSRDETVKRQDSFNQIFERGSTLAQLKIDKAIQEGQ